MLVYSNTLYLAGDDDLEKALDVTAEWLSYKTRVRWSLATLKQPFSKRLSDGSQIIVQVADAEYTKLYAIRFSHQDSEISGSRWITEIGFRQEKPGGEVECGILLRTDELSSTLSIW